MIPYWRCSHPSFRRLLHALPPPPLSLFLFLPLDLPSSRTACNPDIVIIVQHVAVARGSSRYSPSRFMDNSSHYPQLTHAARRSSRASIWHSRIDEIELIHRAVSNASSHAHAIQPYASAYAREVTRRRASSLEVEESICQVARTQARGKKEERKGGEWYHGARYKGRKGGKNEGRMRFFIFEQAGDACIPPGPCRSRKPVIILFSTPRE